MIEREHRARADLALERLVHLARDTGSGEVPEREHARGRERMLDALERDALPVAPRRWLLVPAVAILLLALLGALTLWPERQLDYRVEGASVSESYLSAGPGGATARFSDGTSIAFAPGARARIAAVTARGASVSIEGGSARFRVAHLPGAAWAAEAGPFTVTVTGTEFDLAWEDDRLKLTMQEGAVVVRGSLIPTGITLRGGQRLVADVARGEVTLNERPDPSGGLGAAGSGTPASAAPPPAAGLSAPPAHESSARASAAREDAVGAGTAAASAPPARVAAAQARAGASFRERLGDGDFAGVIAEAKARGIDEVLGAGTLDDVASLADAARYAGQADLARRAMLAERSRFPGSAEARSAAFLLGRLSEGASPREAAMWYDRYLTESPTGPLASEALGRKLVATRDFAGPDAARAVAEEYLKRYPTGAFAAVAAEIVSAR
ncbi:FecR domain-containing protein [Sorangium sp. So ce1078]|uniref:FecR domain-containing protein n=1 Tax=Sorangium sp. So ce1078 TaxID=3133329 RepID=UPI003F627656